MKNYYDANIEIGCAIWSYFFCFLNYFYVNSLDASADQIFVANQRCLVWKHCQFLSFRLDWESYSVFERLICGDRRAQFWANIQSTLEKEWGIRGCNLANISSIDWLKACFFFILWGLSGFSITLNTAAHSYHINR